MKAYFWLEGSRIQSITVGMPRRVCSSWSHGTHSQEGKRKMNNSIQLTSSFIFHFRIPGHGIVLPIVNMALPTSVDLLQTVTHRHIQRLVFWVILDPTYQVDNLTQRSHLCRTILHVIATLIHPSLNRATESKVIERTEDVSGARRGLEMGLRRKGSYNLFVAMHCFLCLQHSHICYHYF